ncbi:MAG TPA: hypothetical protein ENH40_06360 [Nitrospirae bacterium]|nr:hypothetical protein [Nitrospirota bacterium]
MNLSDKDNLILSRFEKDVKTLYLNYIVVGFFFCMTIFGLVIWIGFGNENGIFTAIYCGTVGIILFLATRSKQKLHTILLIMKQHIEELEKILKNQGGS